jgi:hypothetical protein
MLFVTERRRSRRAPKARSGPAMFAPPICRRSRRNGSKTELIYEATVSSDPTKTAATWRTSQRAERAFGHGERSERSN